MVRIRYLINSKEINPFVQNVISVKLTGDGTNLGRIIHVVNFPFVLLQGGSLVQSPSGNHTIAIFRCQESYSDLFTGLADIREEVTTLTTLIVDGYKFSIHLFWGEIGNFQFIYFWGDIGNFWPFYVGLMLPMHNILVYGANAHQMSIIIWIKPGLLLTL